MKIGDEVNVRDGSYSKVLDSDSNVLKNGYVINLQHRLFNVIAVDGDFPACDLSSRYCTVDRNDIMLKAQDNGEIVFICSRFVSLYEQPVEPEPEPEPECQCRYPCCCCRCCC